MLAGEVRGSPRHVSKRTATAPRPSVAVTHPTALLSGLTRPGRCRAVLPGSETPDRMGERRGPDGVPGEGALRQARRAGDTRHRRREARGRSRRRRAAGWPGRRQGTGQGRRPRQGRRREARREPRGSGREGHRHPRHGHQGPHRAPGADRADRGHRRRVLLLLPGRPHQPRLPLHRQRRGRCRDRGGRAHQPRRHRPRLDRPAGRRRRREGRRDRLRVALPAGGCRWRRRTS